MTASITATTGRKRTAARLAAVQALYEMDVSEAGPDLVIGAFLKDRWLDSVSDPALAEFDAAHFAEILRAVTGRRDALDETIGGALSEKMQVGRLEVLLRAILRAGAYELSARHDIPAKVIINEYLEIAHAFYSGREPGLVNAVLDRMASGMGREAGGGVTAPEPSDNVPGD